jgi:hypothetical protein
MMMLSSYAGQPSMLYTISHSLIELTPRTQELNDIVLQQRNLDALAVDIKNNIVFWTDRSIKKIYRSIMPKRISDLGKPDDMKINNLHTIEDIAYDWMGK